MQIYVIQPGDTLWNISNLFSVSTDELISANEIENPNQLVEGQAIVIPIQGRYHFVQPGETIFSISNLYSIPVEELIRINGIVNPTLISPGVRLYIPETEKPDIYTAAFIDMFATGNRAEEIISSVAPYLTYLDIFTYTINEDGTLNHVDDGSALEAAKSNHILPLLVIANFAEGTFKTEIASAIFASTELQEKLLEEILQVMQEKGYTGVVFDLEYLGRENRKKYVAFLEKAVNKYSPLGYEVSVALAPKLSEEQPGTLYEGHDYEAIGKVVDNVYIMTYEWGWSGGPPLAVAPINEVRRVLDFATSVIPSNKIMMGIPLYGYDWTLPYARGGQWAKLISPQKAISIASQYGSKILYDTRSQSPFFNYYDENGLKHVVWFEDARSIQAKFDLIKGYNLKGLFYWVLGNPFPQNWLLLEDNFDTIKESRPTI